MLFNPSYVYYFSTKLSQTRFERSKKPSGNLVCCWFVAHGSLNPLIADFLSSVKKSFKQSMWNCENLEKFTFALLIYKLFSSSTTEDLCMFFERGIFRKIASKSWKFSKKFVSSLQLKIMLPLYIIISSLKLLPAWRTKFQRVDIFTIRKTC